MGVYARGKKLWIRFRDVGGKWRDASTGYEVGQEMMAQATHDEVVARVAAPERTVKHAPARGITVRAFVADWIAKRRERGLDWRNDESRLKHHVLPELGDLPLAEVRARHIVDLFHRLRTDRERNLAQRTVYNIYTVVAALFRDATLADLIEQSPCILDELQLGPLFGEPRQYCASLGCSDSQAGDPGTAVDPPSGSSPRAWSFREGEAVHRMVISDNIRNTRKARSVRWGPGIRTISNFLAVRMSHWH